MLFFAIAILQPVAVPIILTLKHKIITVMEKCGYTSVSGLGINVKYCINYSIKNLLTQEYIELVYCFLIQELYY